MQLLYIYIGGYIEVTEKDFIDVTDEPFRKLKNIELNFSNKFIFHLDENNKLDVKKNEEYIDHFFDYEGVIKTVSSIIGKNGTGKTSIIDLIKWIQPDNYFNIPYKCIFVYGKIDKETNQVFSILKNAELKCDLDLDSFSNDNEVQNFYRHNTGVQKGYTLLKTSSEIENITQIFYSPVFEIKYSNIDAEHEVHGNTNFIDIATSHLIEQDAADSINGDPVLLSSREVLIRHKMTDVERQFLLVNEVNDFKGLLGFKKPQFIELIVDTSDFRFVRDNRLIQEFTQKMPNESDGDIPKTRNRFIYDLVSYSFFNLARNLPLNFPSEELENDLALIISLIPKSDNKVKFEEWLKEFSSKLKAQNNSFILDRFNSYLNFSNNFYGLNKVDKRFRYGNLVRCRLDLNNMLDQSILSDYFEIKTLTGFLHLDWKFNLHNNGQLSSGEKAKFNLFSRFHSVLKKAEWQSKDLSNLLILIDEGDTLFHPEWQRTYLNDLLKGLKIIFKNTSSIQIIFTTHSPFVTSDLPWYSIIKLDKYEKSGLTKVNYNNDKPTFAANIHDLFADSFYMDKGFVGEFAREKINDLFERIFKISKEDEISLIEKEIRLIGEPFVQMSLLKHLENQNSSHE
jgi:hypothetical protein